MRCAQRLVNYDHKLLKYTDFRLIRNPYTTPEIPVYEFRMKKIKQTECKIATIMKKLKPIKFVSHKLCGDNSHSKYCKTDTIDKEKTQVSANLLIYKRNCELGFIENVPF